LSAGSVWSNDVASRRSTWRFANCGVNRSIGSSSWKSPSSNRRRAAEDVTPRQGYLPFLGGPADAGHIDQVPPDEQRGRESGKKTAIDVSLHGRVRRPEVVPGGCDFQVFHGPALLGARGEREDCDR